MTASNTDRPKQRTFRWVPVLATVLTVAGLTWAAAMFYVASH